MENQSKQMEMRGNLSRFLSSGSIRAVEGQERTVELSFSSEEPYGRWWGVEILDHTEGCMDLVRLNEIGCVLFNHKRDCVIGKVIKAWNDKGRGKAQIRFDEDEASDVIYQKVRSGTLKGVSVGYMVESWEEVAPGKKSSDGRFTGPCEIAKRWVPYEISIVSVPADSTVGVGRQMDGERNLSLAYYCRRLQLNQNWFAKKV